MLAQSAPPPALLATPACGSGCITAVTPAEMLRAADDFHAQGRDEAADAILRALADNPNLNLRSEARFRLAKALIARRRYAEAIAQLDRILIERPSAGPARLELARALELSGDHARSLQELARLQAGALPQDLAREIGRLVSTLRSTRPFGGSIEVGIAPDSNVNDATDATVIFVNGLPFALDRSAQRRSGLGLEAAGQLFWRRPMAGDTRLVIDLTGRGTVYRHNDLDDGNVQVSIGPEFRNRLRPSVFVSRRWYLGRAYSWSYGGNVQWLHPIARKTVLDVSGRVEHVDVQHTGVFDATNYAASAALEHAFRPSLFARLSVSANHYQARSPTFTTTSAGTALLLAKDFGRLSAYGQVGYSHLGAEGLFLGTKRRDDRVELSAGVSFRRIRIMGASPIVRVTRVINGSTTVLYDTARTRVEAALSRAL